MLGAVPGPLEEIPVVLLPGLELGGVDTDPCVFLVKLIGAYSLLWSRINLGMENSMQGYLNPSELLIH